MGKITWTDSVRNEEALHRAMVDRDNKKKANWTGHILHRDGLLKHTTEGKIDGISDGKTRKKTCAATG